MCVSLKVYCDVPLHLQIDSWLRKNGHPRLALPELCGYIPAVKYLRDTLAKKPANKGAIS